MYNHVSPNRLLSSKVLKVNHLNRYYWSSSACMRKYTKMEFREWIESKSAKTNIDEEITISSFNLLNRHYAFKNLFGYVAPSFLAWHYRFPLLNKTINQLKCDIMCFQEMECSIYKKHWKMMLKGYDSYFVRKPPADYWGDKPPDFMDGVSIFVNSKRFEVQDKLELHFGELASQGKCQLTDDLCKRLLSRNTVALILKLHDKHTNKTIYVANTHLYWSPKFNDVKVLQTKLLLNALTDFIDVKDPHIIIAGDFNSNSNSSVYRLLDSNNNKTHKINVKECPEFSAYNYGTDNQFVNEDNEINNPLLLTSSYNTLIKPNDLKFTCHTKEFSDYIDHIFISPNNFKVSGVLGNVNESYLDTNSVIGFPDKHFPSDHIPLVCSLYYT
ncbi:glucose-repressible alcohol dehydrogenase transcriptional effector [Scheffersomyces coipomensis]|uniref:glucose-repressible alcohol dehydrogenase transcriptional effector n=1 Tax=Scheffersomyces coipomensis TaxID=1788519 RepID=UPI00315C9BE9